MYLERRRSENIGWNVSLLSSKLRFVSVPWPGKDLNVVSAQQQAEAGDTAVPTFNEK